MMRKLLLAACFVAPILVLLPHVNQFPFQPGNTYSDLLISHYPNGVYIQQSLQAWKTIPLWSDAILSGYPFAANPLSGLFYLPGWLALAFTLPAGFNIAIILHLIFGGVGMYCLLRQEGLSTAPALLGALLFEGMPKLFSHLGAGHITLIYAVTWTPWLLYVEKRTFLSRRYRWILPGAVLGMIALADARWTAYAGVLWLAYSLRISLAQNRLERTGWRGWLRSGWAVSRLVNGFFAALVAAPLLLPLFEYTRLSTRSQLTAQDSFTLSLPFGQLFGLVYPNIGGMAEWILYPSAVGLALLILTLSNQKMIRRAGFWLGLIGFSLLFALGSNFPPLELLARLPGMNLLRVPPRTLFLTGLGFAATAGYGLQHLLAAYQPDQDAHPLRGSMALFAVTAFATLLAAAMLVMIKRPMTRLQFAWGGLALLISVVIILLAIKKRISPGLLATAILVTCVADISGVNRLSLEFRSPSTVLSEKSALVDFLAQREEPGRYRVYSPSYSLPQHVAARAGIQLADGVDPLQLSAYVQYMEGATGVPNSGYSVTLPPFKNAETATDNQRYHPDAARLGLLNVKYLVSEFPLSDPRLTLLGQFGDAYLYQNTLALPRAWVQDADARPGASILSTPMITWQPERIEITAQGPGELVLSEMDYPGWQAVVDGRSVSIDRVGGLLRGVALSAGSHRVTFYYRPCLVYIGLVFAGIAWTILGIVTLQRSLTHDRKKNA